MTPAESESEREAMRRALEEADRAAPSPNPPVGAAVLRGDGVISVGHHARVGAPHAEVVALDAAGPLARGATLVVTLEPCNHHGRTPPCTDAILDAGIARVIYAVADPNPHVEGGGSARLRAEGVAVSQGFGALQARAEAQLAAWRTFITEGRPRVTLKLASSLDGRIATRGGESRWITGPDARADGHALRAAHDVILVGSGTVIADDPLLTVRDAIGARSPTRVVVDGGLRTLPSARVYQTEQAPTWLVTTAGRDTAAFSSRGVEVIEVAADADGHASMRDTMRALASRGVVSALCEGGGGLHGALADARLIDGVVLYLAPLLIGGAGATMSLQGNGIERLSDALGMRWIDVRRVGADLRIEASR